MDNQTITPLQAHYIKRELLRLQLDNEITLLTDETSLRRFGSPFSNTDPSKETSHKDEKPTVIQNTNAKEYQFTITRFIFDEFIKTFPFVSFIGKDDNEAFWKNKIQVFWESFATKQISSTEDRSENTKRR